VPADGRRRREERQRDNQPDDERLGGARRVAGVISRHGRRLLDGEVRHDGSSTAMDGVTTPWRRGTARRLLDGEGRRDGSSMASLDGKGRRERGGDGLRAQRRWAAMDSVMVNGG